MLPSLTALLSFRHIRNPIFHRVTFPLSDSDAEETVPASLAQLRQWKVTQVREWLFAKGIAKSEVKKVFVNRVYKTLLNEGMTRTNDDEA